MCTSSEAICGSSLPRSPSHESLNTELSLFSISSACSDAKLLRVLAGKTGHGPEFSARGLSPNPEARINKLCVTDDTCQELLSGCAVLCAALGLRRSFSSGDVIGAEVQRNLRAVSSEMQLEGAKQLPWCLEAPSRSCSTWAAVAGSHLNSPQQQQRTNSQCLLRDFNKKVRQNYIKRRLLSTYRALERMSQSEFNLDNLEQAAAVASVMANAAGPSTLNVPSPYTKSYGTDSPQVVVTAADLERERGRPLSKYERNMMIFNWLHTLDETSAF